MPIEMNDIEKNRLEYVKEAQEIHKQKFIKYVTANYKDSIELAKKEKDEIRLAHLRALLKRFEQGEIEVASKQVFVIEGSKLYYCDIDKRVKQETLHYTE